MQSGQIVVNAQGRIQDCNAVLEGMTGLTREALLGKHSSDLFSDTSDNLELYLDQLTPRHNNSIPAAAEPYLYQALDQAPVACLVLNAEGQLLFANARAEHLLGYPPQQLQKLALSELAVRPLTTIQTTNSTEKVEFKTQNGQILNLKLDALTYQVSTETADASGQLLFHSLVFLRTEDDLPWAVIRASHLNKFHEENESILTLLKHLSLIHI